MWHISKRGDTNKATIKKSTNENETEVEPKLTFGAWTQYENGTTNNTYSYIPSPRKRNRN